MISYVIWPGGSYDGIDNKLENVLKDINTGEVNDSFTESINNRTKELSNDTGWRLGYMNYQNRLYEERKQGIEQGIEIGNAQGAALKLIDIVMKKVNKNKEVDIIAVL